MGRKSVREEYANYSNTSYVERYGDIRKREAYLYDGKSFTILADGYQKKENGRETHQFTF